MMSDDGDLLSGLVKSKIPYGKWLEDAYKKVALRALDYVSHNGLPDDHHFFISFRTDDPQTDIPPSLKEKYPEEMTIVLQHQFHHLMVDWHKGNISVELSFGGVRSKLTIPFKAITGFVDPSVHLVLQFVPDIASIDEEEAQADEQAQDTQKPPQHSDSQVISLDAFRKNKPKS